MIHPSHFAAVVFFALFASTVFGITMRDNTAPHVPLRRLLLRALRWIGDRVQLGHVLHRSLTCSVPGRLRSARHPPKTLS